MNKIFLFLMTFASFQLFGQSISDDFENYKAGDFIAKTNKTWTTWTNKPGTGEDSQVSSEKAKSGTLSAKFSSTAASGGPTDLILPFFGNLTTTKDLGVFESTMWFFIPKDKTAYFNYQAKNPVGGVWAMDFNFDKDGTFRLACSGAGGLQKKGDYKQDTWFKYSCKIDLTNNAWAISIDDVEVATFSTTNNSLFAMDIFPSDANALFYIDDITTKYTPFVPKQTDAAMATISLKKQMLDGKTYISGGSIRNLGKDTINTIEYTWTDGKSTYTENLTGLNLFPLKSVAIAPKDAYTASAKANVITYNITKVNGKTDEDITNDKKSITVNVVVPAKGKKIIAEEATGTWCQWCPRGHVAMNSMAKEYPDHFIGIAVHGNGTDPMKIQDYADAIVGTGYPSAFVNRTNQIDPGNLEGYFFERIVEAAQAKVEPKVTFETKSREMKIDFKVTFNADVKKGDYKFVAVVLEDSIKGTTTAYNQSNAYAGGASGVMGGYEKLANPVLAAKMFYNHTARKVLTNVAGDALKSNPKEGDVSNLSYSFVIPATSREKHVEVVGFVLDSEGKVVNGEVIDFADFKTFVGTNDLTEHPYFEAMFPNPTSDKTIVALNITETSPVVIQVSDLNGRLVSATNFGTLQGNNKLTIDSAAFPSGIYSVRIKIANEIVTKKLVKN
jgi:hypothetical protein